jgi:hypothetical protein
MYLSPSWEAANCAATQELPKILWNPKFHHSVHKSPPLILSWTKSIQSIPPHPIPLTFILTISTHLCRGLPSGLFPSGFPTNIPYALQFPHSCYMPCSSHPTRLDLSNYTWQRVKVIKSLIFIHDHTIIIISVLSSLSGWYTVLKQSNEEKSDGIMM